MKQPFFFLLVFCIAWNASGAQNRVEATIMNFENSNGVCRACLFTSAASFEKNQAYKCMEATIVSKSASVVFEQVPDGTYAIFVFHDANKNGTMDKNWLGIPKEGYGASGNKLPFAAAPKFEANKFQVSGNTTTKLVIRLRNL